MDNALTNLPPEASEYDLYGAVSALAAECKNTCQKLEGRAQTALDVSRACLALLDRLKLEPEHEVVAPSIRERADAADNLYRDAIVAETFPEGEFDILLQADWITVSDKAFIAAEDARSVANSAFLAVLAALNAPHLPRRRRALEEAQKMLTFDLTEIDRELDCARIEQQFVKAYVQAFRAAEALVSAASVIKNSETSKTPRHELVHSVCSLHGVVDTALTRLGYALDHLTFQCGKSTRQDVGAKDALAFLDGEDASALIAMSVQLVADLGALASALSAVEREQLQQIKGRNS